VSSSLRRIDLAGSHLSGLKALAEIADTPAGRRAIKVGVADAVLGGGRFRLMLTARGPLSLLVGESPLLKQVLHEWDATACAAVLNGDPLSVGLLPHYRKLVQQVLNSVETTKELRRAAAEEFDAAFIDVVVPYLRRSPDFAAPGTPLTRVWKLGQTNDDVRETLLDFEFAVSRYQVEDVEGAASRLKKAVHGATSFTDAQRLASGIDTVARATRAATPTAAGDAWLAALRREIANSIKTRGLRQGFDTAFDSLRMDSERWGRLGNVVAGLKPFRQLNANQQLAAIRRVKGALGEAFALTSPRYLATVTKAERDAWRLAATLRRYGKAKNKFVVCRPKLGVRALAATKGKQGVGQFYDDCVLLLDLTEGNAYPILAAQVKGGQTGLQRVVDQIAKDQIRELKGIIEVVDYPMKQFILVLPPRPHAVTRVIIGPEIPAEAHRGLARLASGAELLFEPALLTGKQLDQFTNMALRAAKKM
jgi:hypothetical protein